MPDINHEIVAYVKKKLAQGVTLDKIREALLSVGHPEDVVDISIQHAIHKQSGRFPKYMVFLLILVIIVVFVVVGYKLTNKPKIILTTTTQSTTTLGPTTTLVGIRDGPVTTVSTTTTTISNEDKKQVEKTLESFKIKDCYNHMESDKAKQDCVFYVKYCLNPNEQMKPDCERIKNVYG